MFSNFTYLWNRLLTQPRMMHFTLLAFFLTVFLILLLRPVARRTGLIDMPAGRKTHGIPALLIGGLSMVIAFKIMLVAGLPEPVPVKFWYLTLGLGIVAIAGLLDDFYQLSYGRIFMLQTLAALIVVILGETSLENVGGLFGPADVHLGTIAAVFSVICILGVINAFNMADGADGLAGSLTLVAIVWFAVLASLAGRMRLFTLMIILIGILLGFLAFNLRSPWIKQATVFMGNAGSMSLGFLVAWFSIQLVNVPESSLYPITMVYIIGLPLIDMARVMAARIARGSSPFRADRTHIHHQLLNAGCTVNQVVAIKTAVSAVLGAAGVAGWYFGVPESLMFYAFLLLIAIYFYLTGRAWCRICMFFRNNGSEPVVK